MALYLISMMSYFLVFLQLLLGSLRLKTYWIIAFVVVDGPLNGILVSSGVDIHFKRPLGNLGHT